MKAIKYVEFGRQELADVPLPAIGPGEVLLKVSACGICGSELEAFRSRSPRRQPPLIMGHEFCGVVEEIGSKVQGVSPGQRVVSNSLVPCGACLECLDGSTHLCPNRQLFGMHRQGAYTEYVAVPAGCLIDWPEGLAAETACLAEPLANGIHMVDLTRHLRVNKVLIIGGGPIGLMAQQAFQTLRDSRVVVADLSPDRLAIAHTLGAALAFDPRETIPGDVVKEHTGGRGFDLVIDAVGGGATKRQSIELARPGGAVIWIGLHENNVSIDSFAITLPERQVLGTYAATLPQLKQAVELLAGGQVETQSWVTAFPIERGVEAFDRMLAAKGGDIKGVIIPQP